MIKESRIDGLAGVGPAITSFLAPCMEVGIGEEDIEGGIQSKL